MTEQDIKRFAAFIGVPVSEARLIVAQDEADEAGIHEGFNYNTQEWVTEEQSRSD